MQFRLKQANIVRCVALVGLSLGMPLSGPALGQPAAAPLATDVYRDLIDAMRPAALIEASFKHTIEAAFAAQLAEDDELAKLEQDSPGLIEAIATAAMPMLRRMQQESSDGIVADCRTLFASRLSPQEAAEMAAFWRSESGYALLSGAVENASNKQVIAAVMADQQVTAEHINADAQAAALAATKQLRNDQRLITVLALSTPAGAKFSALSPEITAIRAKWENADWTPEDDSEMDAVVTAAVLRFYAN